MPEYLSPGVYVEEVDAGPKPIEGVSTSTAGAVGVTERGPSGNPPGGPVPGDTSNRGKPVLVTSFAEFTRTFGGFLPEPNAATVNHWALDPAEGGRWWLFPLSVKGFFDNGGQRLYVKRVFAAGPPGGGGGSTASDLELGTGLIAEVAHDAVATDRQVQLRDLFGIEVGTNVTIVSGGRPIAPAAPFSVTAYNPVTNTVTLNNPVGQELKANRDFLQVARAAPGPPAPAAPPAPAVPDTRTLLIHAKSVGDWGGNLNGARPLDGIRVKVRPMVGSTLRLLPDPLIGGPAARAALTALAAANAVALTVDSIAGFQNLDHVLIRGHEFEVNGAPAANTITIQSVGGAAPVHPAWAVGTPIQRLRPANSIAPAADTINVQGASQLYRGALVELDNGTNKEQFTVDDISGQIVTLSANMARAYFEGNRLRVIEAEVLTRYERDGVVQMEEDFQNLHLFNDGSASYIVNNVNIRSQLVDIAAEGGFSDSILTDFPTVPPPAAPAAGAVADLDNLWGRLDGGDDAYDHLTVDDFVGVDGGSGARTGIQALEDIEDIALCMVPNLWSTTVQSSNVTCRLRLPLTWRAYTRALMWSEACTRRRPTKSLNPSPRSHRTSANVSKTF